MHENREISSTPWSEEQGRSAKAINQTADTHVLEKSDCAVLPVNRPNKEGQPSAEVGEGRAQTKENIVQSHMHPTQRGKRMSQGLDGVRKAAKQRKQERFTALLHHLNVEVKNGSEPAVAGSYEPTGLFEGGEQKMNAGVDGDEKGLSGERHRPALDTIVAEFAGEAVPRLRGEKFRFEIYDLLLLFGGWPGSVALRVNDGGVDGLVRQVGHE
jgi:RNA-directed DNA polymerase